MQFEKDKIIFEQDEIAVAPGHVPVEVPAEKGLALYMELTDLAESTWKFADKVLAEELTKESGYVQTLEAVAARQYELAMRIGSKCFERMLAQS